MEYAKKKNLPQTQQPASIIVKHLHSTKATLCHIQQHAAELWSLWLEKLVESVAADSDVSKAVALKQINQENRVRRLYRRLKPLKSESRSGALDQLKLPTYQCFYHPPTDRLFHYKNGAFFSHARIEAVDGTDAPFRLQRTRQPLPASDVEVA